MRYRHSLILVCASLTLIAGAAPQSHAAATTATTGAVSKPTMTQTKVATATVGDGDLSAATGVAGAAGGANAAGAAGAGGTGTGASVGADAVSGAGSAAGAGADQNAEYNTAGIADAGIAGAAGEGVGAGTGAVGSAGAAGAPAGGESGAGGPSAGMGPPSGFPGGEDWVKNFGGKGPAFWAKSAGGANGHPHQPPVARGWSSWFGGAGTEQGSGKGQRQGGEGMKWGDDGSGGHGERFPLRARGEVLNGGPSWSHVRLGEVVKTNAGGKRSVPMDGPQGQGGEFQGGKSLGEQRGERQWRGVGKYP